MRIIRMVDHQAPPAPEQEEGEVENELVLEGTDHKVASRELASTLEDDGEPGIPEPREETQPALETCEEEQPALESCEEDQPTLELPSEPLTEETVMHLEALKEIDEGRVPEELLDNLLNTETSEGVPIEANLGWLLTRCQRSEEAVERLLKDLEEDPENEDLKVYLGISYQRIGDFESSRKVLEHVTEMSPENLVARRYLANALMNLGEWAEGLLEMEVTRGELAPLQAEFCQDISKLWTGQDLTNKHIVIVSNDRQSDQIQFARYVDKLRKLRPHRIGFVSNDEMVELLRSLSEINRVDSKLFEPFDYFIPVESLPLRMEEDSTAIPAPPYLKCNPRKVESKRGEIKEDKPLLGFCWRNRQPDGIDKEDTEYKTNTGSLELAPLEWHLKELAMDYDIVAFQEDLRLDERTVLANCNCLVVDQEEFGDFMDIAEWLSCLDGLITVDSPIAHLAGALGIDAHVLLPYASDWKWNVKDGVSQWYPNLKIHTKSSEDGWNDCLVGVLDGLRVSGAMQAAS